MASHLYIHYPFCASKCSYCSFFSTDNHQDKELVVQSIIAEFMRESPLKLSENIETVYFGGGTPSLMTEGETVAIFTAISSAQKSDWEVTMEVNPGTITSRILSLYKSLGVNRLSIGVQSLNQKELDFLGRAHSVSQALEVIEQASATAFSSYSVDLIIGLPGQSIDNVLYSLDQLIQMKVPHLSLYVLSIEEGCRFFDQGLIASNDDLQADIYEVVASRMIDAGYIHYEISNFALPGHECQHNMAYWDYHDYLGVGPGAVSMIEGARRSYSGSIADYVGSGGAVAYSYEKLSRQVRISEAIFMGLRKLNGIDFAVLSDRFDVDLIAEYEQVILAFVSKGLLNLEGAKVSLTQRGLMFYNDVALGFIL